MNNLKDSYHLAYSFKNQFYLFEVDSAGNLSHKIFSRDMEVIDKVNISNNGVMKFNLALDKGKMVLIYLLKSGELYLCINDGVSWTEAQIGKFDTNSNIYHQLEVLYLNNKIHFVEITRFTSI